MVPDGKPSREYPGNVGVPQGFFLLYINDFPDNVTCNIAIHADDTTFYSQCEHAPDFCLLDWLLKLNLIYKTLQTGAGSGLLISRLEKLNLLCQSHSSGANDCDVITISQFW